LFLVCLVSSFSIDLFNAAAPFVNVAYSRSCCFMASCSFLFCIVNISAAYFNVLALVKSFCGVVGFAVGVIVGFIIYVSLGLVVLGCLACFCCKVSII
jgi:hypothetical protein